MAKCGMLTYLSLFQHSVEIAHSPPMQNLAALL
jgi:hypothetical protein